jgi:hypothetical protein
MTTKTPEQKAEQIARMLRELSFPHLLLVSILIDILRFCEWVKQIPVRWALWQAGKR